ncbi:MAG: AAA family ATPase [Cyclobacteriaceae bacterium]|nr:AAA family ATPase [Cyclobacteriaceae bacterium]
MASPDDNKQEKLSNNPEQLPYKHRDIKVHSSDEWMANATKKYRKVFDRFETTFMRVEFSFFNKLFDEQNWETSIRMKCFYVNGSQKNELCNLEKKRTIEKDENIVYIRQSWGNAEAGAYWLEGEYVWEGYIDDIKVGERKFYIVDTGAAMTDKNPHFTIESIKLFEGDGNASTLPEKNYLTKFRQAETRFVWCEFKFRNNLPKGYYAEIFFNFYNDAGQLKGTHDYFTYVSANTLGKTEVIFPGWGGETPGRWGNDNYTLEVVYLDTLLATIPFQVGDIAEVGDVAVITGADYVVKSVKQAGASPAEQQRENLLYESLDELNALTGLTNIKHEVNEMVQLVKFYQETGKDVLSRFSLHTVFTGNPGTGKTTVARLLSKIYKGLGILEKGHLVEVDREGLVAGFVGQTAIKTTEKITEAMGGILFIDEAYSLAQGKGSNYDFGAEAIQVILKRMEDFRGKFGVIVAGYTGNMHDFVSSNPGLRSRFDKFFEFTDYSPEDMYAIALTMFKKEDVQPDEAAAEHLRNYFEFLFSHRDQHFGNARAVRQTVGEVVKNQHLRLAAMKKEDRTPELMETVIFADVEEFEIKELRSSKPKLGFQLGGEEN